MASGWIRRRRRLGEVTGKSQSRTDSRNSTYSSVCQHVCCVLFCKILLPPSPAPNRIMIVLQVSLLQTDVERVGKKSIAKEKPLSNAYAHKDKIHIYAQFLMDVTFFTLFTYQVHFIELQFVSEPRKGGAVQAKEVEIQVQLVIFLPNKASFKGPFTPIERDSAIFLSFFVAARCA